MEKEKIKELSDAIPGMLAEAGKKARKSPYLKKMVDIRCDCHRQKSNERRRVKYGVSRCDTYSMNYTLALVLSNYFYQFLADSKHFVIREDYEEIEKHAESFRSYAEADSWDLISKEKGAKTAYLKKEKAFKEAMKWLTNNFQKLWW